MPNWNEMQKKAIFTHDKNILVSASAGSGKTTVLIARLLHLIQDKSIELNRILAMTFTEAAANEMKKRMAKELTLAFKNASSEEEKLYLQEQLASLSSSYISTIHGFCLNIIQNYYYIIGLKKERVENIMDDALTSTLLEKSMDKTFQNFITSDSFLHLRLIFSGRSNHDEILKESILSLFYLANAKSDPIQFLNECRKHDNLHSFEDYTEKVLFYFFDYLNVQVETLEQITTQFERFAIDEKEDKMLATIHEKQSFLSTIKSNIQEQDYTSFRNAFIASSKILFPSIKDNDALKQLKKQAETLEEKVLAQLFEESEFISFSNKNKEYINLLVDIVESFLDTYNNLKRKENCIDFSDMEHFAIDILQAENGLVASIYRDQFIEIMVDEFQDSNDVQDTLVKLICKTNNVFRVGDIKQSIYGFRHATPEIMRSLIANKSEKDEVIYLNNNYRSKKSIVDFNNTLFDTLMNIESFNSSFTEYDHTNCGLPSQGENCSKIHFHMINDKEINGMMSYPKSNDELKASYIAHKITGLIEQGYHYRDFVVLIKTNAKSERLRDAFEDANIPYYINMKYGFFDSSAIMNVITFLKVLQDPNDDLNFIALLLSPFFQWKDEDIAQQKLNKDKTISYFEHMKEDVRLAPLLKLMEEVRQRSSSQILNAIFMIHEYYEKYTNPQEQSNLDKLYELVCNYEEKHFLTLEQLLTIIEQSKDTKIGEAIPIGNDDDVVRVMSIHQSKGLQFPVVFLYSTNTVNLMDTKGMISFDESIKIGMNYLEMPYRYVYPTVERIALNHKVTKAALEEEMRVLYVATTRAQNEMYIIDCGKKEEQVPISKVEIYKKKGFTSWILQTLSSINVSSLYEESYIEAPWDNREMAPSVKECNSLPRYQFAYEESITLSPSDNEFISYRPNSFSKEENYAMERGSALHKMVEILPPTIWTKDLIKSYETKYALSLHDHDYDILLSLYDNDTFKGLQQGSVIHEFPFMIKESSTITHGYMDYVSIKDNVVTMIDFKSDRRIDKETLIQRYHNQISSYDHALKLLYPNSTIRSYIYSFELQEMIKISEKDLTIQQ